MNDVFEKEEQKKKKIKENEQKRKEEEKGAKKDENNYISHFNDELPQSTSLPLDTHPDPINEVSSAPDMIANDALPVGANFIESSNDTSTAPTLPDRILDGVCNDSSDTDTSNDIIYVADYEDVSEDVDDALDDLTDNSVPDQLSSDGVSAVSDDAQEDINKIEPLQDSQIRKIATGSDLILYVSAMPVQGDNDDSYGYYYGDEEEKYDEYGNQTRDRAGSTTGEPHPGSEDNESSGGSEEQSGGWNEADANKRHNVYLSHARSLISGADVYRYSQKFLHKSGATQLDVVKTALDIRLYAQASGLVVAARYIKMQNAIKKLTDDDARKAGVACLYLLNHDKVSMPRDGSAPFTNDIKGYKEFKKVLDKEIFQQTGVDLTDMSAKEIGILIKEGKIQPKITANPGAKSVILRNAHALTTESDLMALANTSLVFQRYIENAKALKDAQGAQKATLWVAADRLIGNDVDLWNGGKQIRKTWRTIKKIKKLKAMLSKSSAAPGPSVKTFVEYKTARSTAATVESVAAPKAAALSSTVSGGTAGSSGAGGTVASATTGTAAVASGAATGGTTVAGTAAATGGAAAAGGGAAAGGSTAAAGGAAAGPIVAVVAIALIIFLAILAVMMILMGSIQAGFQGDRANAVDDWANLEGKDSALADTYHILLEHDQVLLDMIEDGVDDKEAKKMGLTLYEDFGKYADDVSDNYCPFTGQGVTLRGNKEKEDYIIGFRDGQGNRLSIFKSNAKDILSAASVVIGNDFFSRPQTFKRYAENLWYDTHKIETKFITDNSGNLVIHPCRGGCTDAWRVVCVLSEHEEIIIIPPETSIEQEPLPSPETTDNAEETTTVETTPVTEVITVVEETWYFVNQSGEMFACDDFEWDIQERLSDGRLFAFQIPSETVGDVYDYDLQYTVESLSWPFLLGQWDEFDGSFSDGYVYSFCPGHAEYEVVITTSYLNDNEAAPQQSSLFSTDAFTNNPSKADFWNGKKDSWFEKTLQYLGISDSFTKLSDDTSWDGKEFETYTANVKKRVWNAALNKWEDSLGDLVLVHEYIEWDGWTPDNKEWALTLYDQDWYSMYGISFALGGAAGESVEDSLIKDYVSNVDDAKMADILEFALDTVGKIPYYWGGKQTATEKYINHPDISVDAFFNKYYPHINTVYVTSTHLSGYNGWWGCGGLDSKRNIMGLDCSGWVCFVFENFGIQLDHGTGGLKNEGHAVSFSELQPGDLLIDDPRNAHVVMFVRWDDEAHTKYTTVECAGSSGTILKRGVTKRWDYYRRIPLS